MKITIKEDGSLKIDGENNTIIYAKTESGICIETQGNNAHFFTDFIRIEGDEPGMAHEISNFFFEGRKCESRFGEETTIGNDIVRFIGVDVFGHRLYWDESKTQIVIGYTEEEVKIKFPAKKGWIKTLFKLK